MLSNKAQQKKPPNLHNLHVKAVILTTLICIKQLIPKNNSTLSRQKRPRSSET
jgi:hypothetical protein